MIRTAVAAALFGACILLILPWLILWSLLAGNQDLMYRWSMNAVDSVMRLVGVRVQVEGLENIPPGTCLFAANHVSSIDPLAFVPHIPRRVSMLLKKELFRIPILAPSMRLAKFVSVDRASRQGSADSLKQALGYLREGLSFAVYPEGTRSPDGRLQPFKKGAFVMSVKAGVPIVPVSIVGAEKRMPKGHWAIHPGEVTLRFGSAVDTSAYSVATMGKLLERVHTLVAAGLPADQQPLPGTAQAVSPASAKSFVNRQLRDDSG